MSDYHDLVDVKKLEWILENSGKLNLGKSYVKGETIGGDAQLEILRKYNKRAIMFNGSVPQSYYQHDNMGRRFTKDIGLTNLSRPIRHTISKNLIDIDMKNAHPCILLYLCKKYNLHTPFLERYVNNRDELLGELMVGRQLSRDGAKKMLLRAINRDDGKYQQEMNDPDWLYDYHQEMKKTLHNLSLHYPEHMLQAEKSKKRKNVELWNMCGSAVNRVLCDMENKLLCIVEDIVKKNGFIVRVLAYDGCMIERPLENNVLLTELFSMIEEEVNRQYPTLLFKMDEKIMNEGYIVPDEWISEKENELQLTNLPELIKLVSDSDLTDLRLSEYLFLKLKDDLYYTDQGWIFWKNERWVMGDNKCVMIPLMKLLTDDLVEYFKIKLDKTKDEDKKKESKKDFSNSIESIMNDEEIIKLFNQK
jgi:hypothetical protein